MRKFEYCTNADRSYPLPARKTKHSAGYDFVTPVDITIAPKSISELVQTGIKCKMSEHEYLALYIRSSLAIKQGLTLINAVGVIDADYYNNPGNEGNIGLMLLNHSDKEVFIPAGTRVMQGIFTLFAITEDDDADAIRIGGIGSTGKEG